MQNKFLKQDTKLIGAIKKAIKSEIKKRNFRFNHEVFNIKHLTECPRRIMYRAYATGTKQPDFLIENHQKYVKQKWVDFFTQCRTITVLDKDVIAADCNYNVVGSADLVIRMGDAVSAILIDSVTPAQYNKAQKSGGLRRQIVELMMIIWLIEVPNGILICENKETNEYFLSHVIHHKGILDSARKKCSDLLEKKVLHQMPERAYDSDESRECMICEYRGTCWTTKEMIDAEKEEKAN